MRIFKFLVFILAFKVGFAQPIIIPPRSSGGGGGITTNSFNTNQFSITSATNVNIKSGVITTNADIQGGHPSTLSITGNANTPTSGGSLELSYTGGSAYIYPYDRSGSTYLPMSIGGSNLQLQNAGNIVGYLDGTRLSLGVGYIFGWSATSGAQGTVDTSLSRSAAGTITVSSNLVVINNLGVGVTPLSTFDVAGAISTPILTKTTNYTLVATNSVILVNGATLTMTLPTAASISGREYQLKIINASTCVVTNATGAQNIDGALSYSLSAQYKYVRVKSDGTQWWIIANN